MTVTAVVGAQWGDEGKGRIVDYLAQNAHMVIRFQGGDNAGHTVVNEHGTFRLHLVPSGIFNPATLCIIGSGTVIHPPSLLDEMTELAAAGISLDNLWISDRAHVIMPYHRMLDGLEEVRAWRRTDRHDQAWHRSRLRRQGRPQRHPDGRPVPARLPGRPPGARPCRASTGRVTQFGSEEFDLYGLTRQAMGWGNALDGRIIDTVSHGPGRVSARARRSCSKASSA